MRYNKTRYIVMMLVGFICSSHQVLAQQQETQSEQPKPEVERAQTQENIAANSTVTDSGVIQLEAVIRGNQQQPKVLTIVPWQSPERRNALPSPVWQQVRQQLQPLERRNFLQEQQLFEKLSKQ